MNRLIDRLGTPSWAFLATALAAMAFALVAMTEVAVAFRVGDDDRFEPLFEVRRDLERRQAEIETQLRHADWLETLVPATVEDRRRGIELSISHPEGLGRSRADEARDAVRDPDLRRRVDEEIAIGLHAVVGSAGIDELVFGEHDGTPYCIRVQGIPERRLEASSFPHGPTRQMPKTLLGGCTWVHRYGLPGPYLRGALAAFALPNRPWGYGYGGPPVDLTVLGRVAELDAMFDDTYAFSPGLMRQRACALGSRATCASEFEPFRIDLALDGVAFTDHASTPGSLLSGTSRGIRGPDLFTALEADFGTERFERFWTSPDRFDVAFAAAFGKVPEAWLAERFGAAAGAGAVRPGPLPRRGTIPTGLALSIVSILGAGLISRRRGIR